jgi:hypothetical protein
MSASPRDLPDTSTLNTKLEEDFVSPLTAVRGALEILRDFPDLEPDRRQRFVENALRECARLEGGVNELAAAVYAAARRAAQPAEPETEPAGTPGATYASRIRVLDRLETIEIDFSDFEFSNTATVNAFFDAIEAVVRPTNRQWYFMTNFRNCSVWPEAWVAFAHRGKKIRVNHALGAVRYAETEAGEPRLRSRTYEPGLCASRDEALAEIEQMKSATKA